MMNEIKHRRENNYENATESGNPKTVYSWVVGFTDV